MQNAPTTEDPRTFQGSSLRSWGRAWLATLCLWVGASGCGPAESPTEPLELDSQIQAISSHNGVSANGLSANGLSANGLSANGLSANGLSAAAFASWFSDNPGQADMLMTYVIRCAVPAGQSRSFTRNGRTYTWHGGLGLAPDWASGHSINHNEQQVVTACLLAHVNRFGRHINISVLGLNAWGNAIPFTFGELALYGAREACFFGTLFTPNSLFFGVDQSSGDESRYVTRACGAMEPGSDSPPQCAPMRFVGRCSQLCTSQGSSGLFYTNCTYNGVSYRPLTTRMRVADFDELFPDWGG